MSYLYVTGGVLSSSCGSLAGPVILLFTFIYELRNYPKMSHKGSKVFNFFFFFCKILCVFRVEYEVINECC